MGVVLESSVSVFPNGFPAELVAEFEKRIGRPTLGNKAASVRPRIIDELGPEHIRTRLTDLVHVGRQRVSDRGARERDSSDLPSSIASARSRYHFAAVGRGIAALSHARSSGIRAAFREWPTARTLRCRRPTTRFSTGSRSHRNPRRRDRENRGICSPAAVLTRRYTASDDDGMDAVERAMHESSRAYFANLVDFDTVYGHRDPHGYAANLERFDARLSELLPRLGSREISESLPPIMATTRQRPARTIRVNIRAVARDRGGRAAQA